MVFDHPDIAAAIVTNKDRIPQGHTPELCYSWVSSNDPNDTEINGSIFTDACSRTVSIHCLVDVKVFNSSNKLIAATANGTFSIGVKENNVIRERVTRILNCNDIPIVTDDILTLYVPAIST